MGAIYWRQIKPPNLADRLIDDFSLRWTFAIAITEDQSIKVDINGTNSTIWHWEVSIYWMHEAHCDVCTHNRKKSHHVCWCCRQMVLHQCYLSFCILELIASIPSVDICWRIVWLRKHTNNMYEGFTTWMRRIDLWNVFFSTYFFAIIY